MVRGPILGVACLLAATLVALPSVGSADPTSQPGVYRSLEFGGARARNHSRIDGRVSRIDYASGIVFIQAADGVRAVVVTPTTQIYVPGRGDYATMADIRPGSFAEIDVNEVAGRLIAQIIRLR